MSQYNVLIARLNQELTKIQAVVDTAVSQLNKAKSTGDLDYLQAAALSLQNFYMGVEQAFEEIAKRVDQSLPTGANSHRALLEQMGLEIPEIRPPVIRSDTLAKLNEYRGFRHVVVHRYGFELHPQRIQELVEELPNCYDKLTRDMQHFSEFLMQLNQSL
ncbi:MAG: hypothetical protein MUF49_19010 [Oculatellaceae cyanobacterium Prado106]|jgi:hypothetical protein|nr:hypothetical protein [Oculatellaceae cyanobacterium Prado106]